MSDAQCPHSFGFLKMRERCFAVVARIHHTQSASSHGQAHDAPRRHATDGSAKGGGVQAARRLSMGKGMVLALVCTTRLGTD
jgi:hypothetical protein